MSSGKKIQQKRNSLNRFLIYVLGHRPDEFGLFADEEGYVPIKDLLAALSEEEGWRSVREGNIRELLRDPDQSGLEIKEKMIRVDPGISELNPGPYDEAMPPKLLYHAARRKGYPVILENGLTPGARPFIPLSASKEMALRIGKRRDQQPVLLTILAEKAGDRGVVFYRPQELIYLVDSLAPDLFSGPPLPKEGPAPEKKKKEEVRKEEPTPGSFFLDPDRGTGLTNGPDKSKKKKKGDVPDWKRSTRRDRRRKRGEF